MTKLAQLTTSIGAIQAQIKNLSSSETTKPKRKYYCWIFRRNFSHGSKECMAKKVRHKNEAYDKKYL